MGLDRFKSHYVLERIPLVLLENIRQGRTFRTKILSLMDNWGESDSLWWNDTEDDARRTEEYARLLNGEYGLQTIELNEDGRWRTNMKTVFDGLQGIQRKYNWLIHDAETMDNRYGYDVFDQEFCWISGEELTRIVNGNPDEQWVWAHLMGFEKDCSPEEAERWYRDNVLADEEDWYNILWRYPAGVKHARSAMDIIAYDSSQTLVLTDREEIVEEIHRSFPNCERYVSLCRNPR